MKLTELKQQVFALADVSSVASLKGAFPQWQQLNFRSKEVWEFVLQELQKQEQEENEERLIAEVQEEELAEAKVLEENLAEERELIDLSEDKSFDSLEIVEDIINTLRENPPLSKAIVRRREQAELAAQRIAKQGTALKGTFKSRRVLSDKSKGFAK